MNKKTYIPFAATHPGEMIKDELKERGITQKQLAELVRKFGWAFGMPMSVSR